MEARDESGSAYEVEGRARMSIITILIAVILMLLVMYLEFRRVEGSSQGKD